MAMSNTMGVNGTSISGVTASRASGTFDCAAKYAAIGPHAIPTSTSPFATASMMRLGGAVFV